ncbi:uncharacterized protein LOC132702859 [Cylas formicarius]|uniref:uncharacterized protein LOC132702859 n=1 Tax=Cylas formicarius TaxID=197179 RepID=UPI00295883BA|nr:uncharacterized protein LOC132702859 [Cylas formicarius]
MDQNAGNWQEKSTERGHKEKDSLQKDINVSQSPAYKRGALLLTSSNYPTTSKTGPGENESSDSGLPFFSDGDFKTEGPVYEAYAQVFEDKRYNGTSSTFRRTEGVLCVSENDAINEELAAIATLKLTTDQCVGMRETKSNPISKILFWDDCDESENACKVGNNSKPRPFKSDTDYYNKHIKDTTFV